MPLGYDVYRILFALRSSLSSVPLEKDEESSSNPLGKIGEGVYEE